MLLGKNQTNKLAKKRCKFAGSDFKFLKLEYIVDSLYSDSVINPTSYQLHPVGNFSANYVNDMGPLLMEQRKN